MSELNTEQPEVTIDGTAAARNSKNPLGQFNSPEALYKSYTELQREYTKKCQALKDADKLTPRAAQARFEELIEKYPQLIAKKDNIAASDMGALTESLARLAAEKNYVKIDEEREKIRNEIYGDEELRNKIFNEMLEDFASVQLPKHAKNRGQIPMTPSLKPKSLNEAASMARNIIKTRRVN